MKWILLFALFASPLLGQMKPPPPPRTSQYQTRRTPRGSIPHQATLNWSNTSCTTAKPCAIQIWRAQCATTCPIYSPGASGWIQPPSSTTTVTVSAGSSSTSWQVIDADTGLADSTTYVWIATNSYQSTPTQVGLASAPWSGETGAAPATPPAPTVGAGNSIQ